MYRESIVYFHNSEILFFSAFTRLLYNACEMAAKLQRVCQGNIIQILYQFKNIPCRKKLSYIYSYKKACNCITGK